MSETISYVDGIAKGRQIKASCKSCTGKTSHLVYAALVENGDQDCDGHSFWWRVESQIIQCQGCQQVSFRQQSMNSEETDCDESGKEIPAVEEQLFPSRIAGRTDLGNGLRFLPPDLKRIYQETLSALANQCPVLAGIGLRAILETVCKEKATGGANLFEKINALVTNQVLTPASAAILHKIRTLGNDAAHEVKPHSETQLGLALDVMEHLLKDVYILPKQVASEFK
jgi:Domain of unknown function (DUF4145)